MVFIHILIGIFLTFHSTTSISLESKNSIQHIYAKIKAESDLTADPCKEFQKYACGNQKSNQSISELLFLDSNGDTLHQLKLQIEKLKSLTAIQQKVKDFLNSLEQEKSPKLMFQQIESLKAIRKWPTDRNHTRKEIARLIAEFYFEGPILKLSPFPVLKLKSPIGGSAMNKESITKTLLEFDVSGEDILKYTQEILQFYDKLREAEHDDPIENLVPIDSIENLKKHVPDFDWEEYFTVLKVKLNISVEDIYWFPEKVTKILNVCNATTSRTVVNFLIYNYIQDVPDIFTSANALPYFRPMMKELFNQTLTENIQKYEHNLNYFEKSVNKLTKKLRKPNLARIQRTLEEARKFIANYDRVLSETSIQDFYAKIDTYAGKFYLNMMNFMNNVCARFLVNVDDSFLQYSTMDHNIGIDYFIRPKSDLFYFLWFNKNMWEFVLDDYAIVNSNDAKKCLARDHILSYFNDMQLDKLNYLNYIEHVKNTGGDVSEEFLKSIGVNSHARLYFITLAQQNCKQKELFVYLPHLKEFNEVFECSDEKLKEDCISQNCLEEICPLENIFKE